MSDGNNTATLEDVLHVAELAHLHLTADEQAHMLKDLNAILGHVAELSEVDTSSVAPMASGLPVGEFHFGETASGEAIMDSRAALRPDAVRPSLDRLPVMQAAPETDGVFFKVPKVIER